MYFWDHPYAQGQFCHSSESFVNGKPYRSDGHEDIVERRQDRRMVDDVGSICQMEGCDRTSETDGTLPAWTCSVAPDGDGTRQWRIYLSVVPLLV